MERMPKACILQVSDKDAQRVVRGRGSYGNGGNHSNRRCNRNASSGIFQEAVFSGTVGRWRRESIVVGMLAVKFSNILSGIGVELFAHEDTSRSGSLQAILLGVIAVC